MGKNKLSALSLVIVLGGVALAILIIYLVVMPGYQNLKKSSLSLANSKAELNAKQEKLDNLKSLEPTMQSSNDKVNALRYALPREKDMPEVLYVLSAIANKDGVYIGEFSNQSLAGSLGTAAAAAGAPGGATVTEITPTVKQLSMQLTILGDYPKLVAFMKDLEASRKIFQVESLKIILPDPKTNQVSTKLGLVSYFQVDN